MKQAQVGIIGGTGLGDTLMKEAGGKPVEIDTPFGLPSSKPILANWEGIDVAFIARHGEGHLYNPSTVPYRANIWAMKKLGVTNILASGATGSLREDIEPGQLVLCDQLIDKTFRRAGTFFDDGIVVHIELADPFCPQLRKRLTQAGESVDTTIHHTGTYVCMEGPQFSTRAESHMHRQWGGDVIGMTCMPEARLAREAEICYALIALPTDYDCWRPADAAQEHNTILESVLENLKRASRNAIELIHETLKRMKTPLSDCPCQESLKLGIWTDRTKILPAVRDRLEPLIGRYLADKP